MLQNDLALFKLLQGSNFKTVNNYSIHLMHKTTLIISTRDRPNYLEKALKSVLKQTRPFDNVIISDNSSSKLFKDKNKTLLIPYLKRSNQHIRLIPTPIDFESDDHTKYIQDNYIENDGYCVIFHDDDELLPHYHETAISAINTNNGIVAVGCNALRLRDTSLLGGTVMRYNKGIKIIQTKRELLQYYMLVGPTSPPPLSGYLFRAKVLKSLPFSSAIGGKYSDVVALSEATKFGKIIWVYTPSLLYRTHYQQDSHSTSTLGFRSLYNYIIKSEEFDTASTETECYRFKHMRLKLRGLRQSQKWRSEWIITHYLICFTLKRLIWRWQTYGYLWSLIRQK